VSTLHRTVPLTEREHPPVGQAQHLNLDVPGTGQVALQQDRRRPEEPLGPTAGGVEGGPEFGLVTHRGHADTAASGGGLDHQRVPDPRRLVHRGGQVGHRFGGARRHRYPGGGHQVPRGDLVAHGLDGVRVRTDPDQSGLPHLAGESSTFRQEAVAGVHRLRAAHPGRLDDRLSIEVGLGR
jgi:hypothetical protein